MEIRIMKIIKVTGSHHSLFSESRMVVDLLLAYCSVLLKAAKTDNMTSLFVDFIPGSVAGGCPGCSVVGGSVAYTQQLPGDLSPVRPSVWRWFSVKKNQNMSTKKSTFSVETTDLAHAESHKQLPSMQDQNEWRFSFLQLYWEIKGIKEDDQY